MVNRLELPVMMLALLAVWLWPRTRHSFGRRARLIFIRIANRKNLAVLLTGIMGGVLSAAAAVLVAWPEPQIHDEFSYLLAADTFASGRLTNPAHPLWMFFETFHVNVRPTYCSIYPPGQGLLLAFGQVLTGHAIAGVWIGFGLASAAVCWMLQAYLPPRWALFGTLLCVIRVGFLGSWAGQQGYWTQSYWGGAVAMLGGALVFGSVPRLLQKANLASSVALGSGLAVLALSRPYEGLAIGLPIGIVAIAHLIKRPKIAWHLVPALLILALTLAGIGFYNFRLTGNPLRLAYQESGDTYAVAPTFIWQSLRPEPDYRHDVIRDYQTRWAVDRYLAKRSVEGYAGDLATRFNEFTSFFLGTTLLVPFVALPWILRSRWMRLAACGCGSVLVALCLTTWFQPHYAAPLTAPLFALAVQGLRYVRLWKWDGKPAGRWFVRAAPRTYALLFVIAIWGLWAASKDSWHLHRARILRDLESGPGTHLVIVRYGPDHECTDEWVYNRADIDAARVVWARDMGGSANQPLLEHFAGRQVWRLQVNGTSIELVPYRDYIGEPR